MSCLELERLDQHELDIRALAANPNLTDELRQAAARATAVAVDLLKEHKTSGHDGQPCPVEEI